MYWILSITQFFTKPDLQQLIIPSDKKPSYTHWLTELIDIIVKDSGLGVDELALTESDCAEQYAKGKTPHQVYHEVWHCCAGNFYKIKF